nr:immunoglobulin heavy chain junction region [Macaca mulatta]MOV49929.1 immunoglobulin heavy chain junction region [Macaca mulatta]MOV49993.1 immunoglobulin heavy chain junction region [Macaca mulatta]MOV50244.1 immunoglobulin heavy chain junction region [Macaca mulatta]MOV50396.1 immunoglobulin heavy chain junction region [Macaca mulatta]
CARQHSNYDYW